MKQAINIIVNMILLMAMAISILPAGAFAESEVPEVTDVTLSEPAETETETAEQAALAESTPEEALPNQDAADAGAEETSAEIAEIGRAHV